MKKEYISSSPQTTKKLGCLFAQSLEKRAVICLVGDLGGGKTTFVQGLAEGFGIQENIRSPSFVLLKRYKIPRHKNIKHLYHLDCYRLEKSADILGIGYEEILEDKNAVVIIEWADRIRRYLPKERIDIDFEFIDQNKRRIVFRHLK